MSSLRTLADRIEVAALPAEFADAGMTRDLDRLANLFTEDGVWRIPGVIDITGRAEIRAAIDRLQGAWEFLIQQVHPGSITFSDPSGDTATGRSYIHEVGRFRDGALHVNYSVYHDQYRRTADGWRFAARSYEVRHVEGALPDIVKS